ncbi:penicillin-binding transpeptidase domain-containing protein [Guggenheimella bovis]
MNKERKTKMYLAYAMVCLLFLAIAARIFSLQFIKHQEYTFRAMALSKKDVDKPALRGSILDRNLDKLAYSVRQYDLWVNKNDLNYNNMDDKKKAALEKSLKLLEDTVGLSKDDFYQKVSSKAQNFKLAAFVTKEQLDKIYASPDKPRWMSVHESYKRHYPMGTLASNFIGTTNSQGNGISGLESSYDSVLKGLNGKYVMDTDRQGNPLVLGDEEKFEPIDGYNIVTSVDRTIQYYIDTAIKQGFHDYKPEMITAIMLETKTGEVLGMGTYPNYDPNDPFHFVESPEPERVTDEASRLREVYRTWKNAALSWLYEPGSVSKILTVAAGIDSGRFRMDTTWVDKHASIKIADAEIRCASFPNPHGVQTTEQALINSCNVAHVLMGLKMGVDLQYDYFQAFNLTYRSNLGLSVESFPAFQPRRKVGPVESATMTFGQGYSVTPLQLVSAINSVVNDGKLMEAHIIKKITAPDGSIVEEYKPKVLRQVISKETSAEMRTALEHLVRYYNFETGGIRIGGKTGTTQKLIDGVYSDKRFIYSFACFAPANDPKYTLLVIVDDPDRSIYKGNSSIRLALTIMQNAIRYGGVDMGSVNKDAVISVPDCIGLSPAQAKDLLTGYNLSYSFNNNDVANPVVIDQYPKPGQSVMKGAKIILNLGPKK